MVKNKNKKEPIRIKNKCGLFGRFVGWLAIGIFYGVWVSSIFIIPTSLILYIFYNNIYPIYFLIFYYSFRFIKKRGEFLFMRKYLFSSEVSRWCKSQEIIWEEGGELPKPNEKRMISLSPHGCLSLGWTMTNGSALSINAKFKWLATENLFYLPFISDILRWTSTVSIAKKNLHKLMKSNENISIMPGGFEEATLFKHNKYRMYIKKRKGFIKYALQYGYKIHPTYVFGEEKSYWTFQPLLKFRLWLNKYKFPGCLFIGKYLIYPNDNFDLTVVIGKPIELPKLDKIEPKDVEKWHKIYIKEITDLFNRWKNELASPDAELEIY